MRFRDRADGGRRLAELLAPLDLADPLVLALPRGGVPVGFEVARAIGAPLDVFVTRKVGAPGQPEFGIGAVGEGGTVVVDHGSVRGLGLSDDAFDALVERERDELRRRVRRYRGDRELPDVAGRDVVLVDDGLATGVTAEAAVRDLRRRTPARILLAAPVGAPDTVARLKTLADDVRCVDAPEGFGGVGRWYDRFDQMTDDEVLDLLARAAQPSG